MTPAPKRRWFRYSLRTLFVVVTVAAVFGWLGWNLKKVRERENVFASLRSRGVMFGTVASDSPQKELPLVWRLFGVKGIGLVEVPAGAFTEDDLYRLTTLFPEATIRDHLERMDQPNKP
jgi:hypothetical protein